MAVTSLLTYQQALGARAPFWRLEITNWGNRQTGAAADGTSLLYPGNGQFLESGAQTIVIGPDSTADAAIVEYNPFVTGVAFVVPNPAVLDQESMSLSTVRPLSIMPGGIRFRAARSTMFADTYVKDGVAGSLPFGTSPVFEAPTLQLLTFPQQPSVPIFAKRNDMYREALLSFAAPAAEAPLAMWPVMGRKRVALYFRATGTVAATVRVGVVSSYIGGTFTVPTTFGIVEDTDGTGALDAAASTQYAHSVTKLCQWVIPYVTVSAGAGSVFVNLIASDE